MNSDLLEAAILAGQIIPEAPVEEEAVEETEEETEEKPKAKKKK